MFRKQRFEIRRKNKSDFFDHSTTLISTSSRKIILVSKKYDTSENKYVFLDNSSQVSTVLGNIVVVVYCIVLLDAAGKQPEADNKTWHNAISSPDSRVDPEFGSCCLKVGY